MSLACDFLQSALVWMELENQLESMNSFVHDQEMKRELKLERKKRSGKYSAENLRKKTKQEVLEIHLFFSALCHLLFSFLFS